jgi:hypothetical protein
MISIEFDKPSFFLGETITGRIVMSQVDIEKFVLALKHRVEVKKLHEYPAGFDSPDNDHVSSDGRRIDSEGTFIWENELLSALVEIGANSTFEIPTKNVLQYTSKETLGGESSDYLVRCWSVLSVSGVFRDGSGEKSLETSAEVIITPPENAGPITYFEDIELSGDCCSRPLRTSIEIHIPQKHFHRGRGPIPIKVVVSGYMPISASAFLVYAYREENPVKVEAGRSKQIRFNRFPASVSSSVTVPLDIEAPFGWQTLVRTPGTPHVAAELNVQIRFDCGGVFTRGFDVSIV